MTLLGDKNWYLPTWLKWLPQLSIGEESGGYASEKRHHRKPVIISGFNQLGLVPTPILIKHDDAE